MRKSGAMDEKRGVRGEKGKRIYNRTYLGCLETDHNPEEINFSSCFLLSFSDLHCDFSVHQQRTE
jgi:hypothetical protein